MQPKILSRQVLWSTTAVLIYLALAKLLIHLLTANGYGYFGDELYWQALANRLDFGYVDVPPLTALPIAISRWIIGTSLFAIHILPAIVGAIMVFLAGLLVREMGGGRFSQWFMAIMVLAAPYWLVNNSLATYEPFDQLCVLLFFYLIVRIVNQESPKRWVFLGIVAGLGVMTKLSMIFPCFALIIAVMATNRRKSLITWWPWLAVLIAVAICLPYINWQSVHGWPLLKYWRNYALMRPHNSPQQFFEIQMWVLNPATLPIWLMGLYYLLFHREGKKYRVLAIMHIALLIYICGVMRMEYRIMTSAYFPLLAAGAICFERILLRIHWNWVKPVYTGVILLISLIIAPNFLPVLPLPVLEKYLQATQGTVISFTAPGQIPFNFGFELGWPEMVKQIADVYHSLPEADQKKCVIYTSDYPEAAAVELFGKAYGLPNVISNHLTYQAWGPGNATGEVVIAVGKGYAYAVFTDIKLRGYFDEVEHVAIIPGNKYSVPFEQNLPVFVCRKPTTSLKKIWEWHEDYF